MGSESSKSGLNSHSNSGKKNGNLESIDSLEENHNIMIYRAWIVKNWININDINARKIGMITLKGILISPIVPTLSSSILI